MTVRHPIDDQQLIELGHRSQRRDAPVEVRAGCKPDAIPRVLVPVRDGDDGRDAKIARHVEHPQAASHRGEPGAQIPKVVVAQRIEVDLGTPQTIVPPDRAGVPLDQFEETLNDRFLKRIAGRATVRVSTDPVVAGRIVKKIQEAGRKVLETLVAQRPNRRPFHLGRGIEAAQSRARARCAIVALLVRRFAQQQNVIGKNRVARLEIRKPAGRSDLVALEYPAIALEGAHQGARFALFRGAPHAVAVADQAGLRRIEGFGTRRKVVSCKNADGRRLLAVDPLKVRHHASQRADVLSNASDRLGRRRRPIAAARHDGLSAGTEPDRCSHARRIPQFLATARRALRPSWHMVPDDRRCQQIEADDVVAQVGAKFAGDGLGDLDRGEPDRASCKHVLAEWRCDHAASLLAIEKRFDLPVPFHAIGKASPAGALSRAENRTDQGKNAGRLRQEPILLSRQLLAVEFRQLAVEIVVHQNNGQVGRTIDDANAELAQRGVEVARSGRRRDWLDSHADLREILRGGFGVKPEARPIACGRAVDQVCGNDEAAIEQALQGFVDLDCGEFTGKRADDSFPTLSCAYARSKRAVEFAAKKDLPALRIEADDSGRQNINRKIWREPDLAIALPL